MRRGCSFLSTTLSGWLRLRSSSPLLLGGHEPRMSLAGAQDKVGVQFEPKTRRLFEPLAGTPSTHILKPDSRLVRYQPSAINEYACMKLACALERAVRSAISLRRFTIYSASRLMATNHSRSKVRTEIESEKGILTSEREMLTRMDAVFETQALWWTEMIAP